MSVMHPRARLLLLDIVAILVFVTIGRRTHDEGSAVGGIAKTAAPFTIAMLAGWVLTRAWKRPYEGQTGTITWIVTVALGLLLRRTIFDRGTATAFVIVATVFLGVTLIGWRFVFWRNDRRSAASTRPMEINNA